jgi:predicted nucleotidyltransferase
LSTERIAKTKSYLTQWAKDVESDLKPQGIYLFGSLIYRDGAQFNDKSDVDLAVIMPEIPDAADRADWLEKLLRYKVLLEDELGKLLQRTDRSALISSVVAATMPEVAANIHKDGVAKFFSNNQFLDLSSGEILNGLPDAGKRIAVERLVGECFRFVQKTRNAYLGVNSLSQLSLNPFDDREDAAPKPAMRHAAMIQYLKDDGDASPGAEFDLDIGADTLTVLLHERRKRLGALSALYRARRSGRGAREAISSKDQLVLAELIFDAAIQVEARVSVAESSPKLPTLGGAHSTVLFAQRFDDAFPGVRGIAWFDGGDTIKQRLARLLKQPLEYEDGTPIWWTRGPSNLQITSYREASSCLLINDSELNVVRLAAAKHASYKYNFVYVEVDPLPPIGIYERTPDWIAEVAAGEGPFPYYWEEYGLVDGVHLVTRAEADDGSAVIEGKLQSLHGRLEVRGRYVTKYNFIIAAGGAPIMNSSYDYKLEEHLNAMLRGEDRLSEIFEESRRFGPGRY